MTEMGDGKVDFDRFLQKICPLLDLEWRKYRRRAARHRVEARIKELGLSDYPSYLDRLETDPSEAARLADLMRVTVSRFFRDRTCWTDLAKKVFPQLISEKPGEGIIHVWSAGSCGGEEPYSVALLWLEYLQPLFPCHTIDILATDIDKASHERARKGIYGTGSLREVPAEMLMRRFSRGDGLWLLDERVKELVRFEEMNLMCDTPPSGIDLVLCRYLAFTYYRGMRRSEATQRLWDALRPGGALMIGRKEALDFSAHQFFHQWPDVSCVYRKLGNGQERILQRRES
jgi:chemotaxis protein methyltransferase CheR